MFPDWMRPELPLPEPEKRTLFTAIRGKLKEISQEPVINGMLHFACPVCGRLPGRWCDWRHQDYGPGTEMIQFGTEAWVCAARLRLATSNGYVRPAAVRKLMPPR